MKRPHLTLDDYIDGIRSRNRAILGRALSLVESDNPAHGRQAQELLRRLLPETGRSHRIGISGVPGAGKSTFIESIGVRLVDRGRRVAVLAVDPSSSRSRGSILGDKTRMERLSALDAAFIRPSPTGGSLGGVSRKTRETILICEAAGFDIVLVETVGVGQSETMVADMVDTYLVLVLAGAGDELQGIKRGILELADIIAVNKADGPNRENADSTRSQYQQALELLRPSGNEPWNPRALTCSALTGDGLDDLWRVVEEHRNTLSDIGLFEDRRRRQQLRWMWSMVDEALIEAVRSHPGVASKLRDLESAVLDGTVPATTAAEMILEAFGIARERT